MKRIAHLLGFWLWIGFIGGAAVLFLIATPVESHFKASGMAQRNIDFSLAGIAFAWVLASFGGAWLLERRIVNQKLRIGAHAAGIAVSAIVFNIFLQAGAGFFSSARADEDQVGRFLFGPFPDEKQMARLKAEGYTGVIALLNSVIPFEAVLLEKERAAAEAAGLKLIEIPMLPWISENRESINTLKSLAQNGQERYYVHCYLGRHRVDLARSTLLEAQGLGGKIVRTRKLPAALERGEVRVIGEIAVGPLPTEEEWFHDIGRAGVKHVISLLDPAKDAARIEEETKACADLDVTLHVMPARNAKEIAAVADLARSLNDKVYIHAHRPDKRTQGVIAALESD